MKSGTPTMIYVDGFNLYYGALKGTPFRWLDLAALFRKLFPQNDIRGIRYFTALVHPQPGNAGQPMRQQLYLRALATLPSVEITFGHYLTKTKSLPLSHPPPAGPKFASVVIAEEKGSDVNLASYLLLDAFHGRFDCAIVLSADSDLATPIEMVRREFGKTVGVQVPQCSQANPGRPPRRAVKLQSSATFFRQDMRPGILAASQFPSQLTDATGVFHKPPVW